MNESTPLHSFESTPPGLETRPYEIYILHMTGVRREEISPRHPEEFALAAFWEVVNSYKDPIAAALYAPNGKRLGLVMIDSVTLDDIGSIGTGKVN